MLRGILIQTNTLALNLTICLHGYHDEFSAATWKKIKSLCSIVCACASREYTREHKLKLLIVRKVFFVSFAVGKFN